MIDVDSEDLIPFAASAAYFPGRPSVATLQRWRLKGVRGNKLATIVIGGRRWTSHQAIARFIAAGQQQPAVEAPDDRLRRARQAGAALQAIGS